MEKSHTKINQIVTAIAVSTTLSCSLAFASNINPVDKYAWSENSGWFNFSASNGQVRVFKDHLEGYVWSENVGWIRLGSYDSGGSYSYTNSSASDWGVNNDASGNLSGYAWSENVGWINFNSGNGGPVTVDAVTGAFDGYAWSENVGWIHFQNASPVAYQVNLQAADLSVSKTVTTSPVTPGDNLIYTISVMNNSSGIADNIELVDSLPAGLSYVSVNAAGWNCNHATGIVTCTLDTLGANSSTAIELTVSSDPELEESLTNTAVASLYGPDSDPENNSGSDTTYFGLGDSTCSGYDAEVTGDFTSPGMYRCVGRNTLETIGDVNLSADTIVYFQSPQSTLDKGFKVNQDATFTLGDVGNVTPHISGPADLIGTLGDILDLTLTHQCEDYEDGAIAIDPASTGILDGLPGDEVFTISCTDIDGKTAIKLITVDKVE